MAVLLQSMLLLSSVWYLIHASDSPHPGHLLPFGDPAAGSRPPVASMKGFPTPAEFFARFVRPSRPVIFKSAFNESKAFQFWEDDYLRQLIPPEGTDVEVQAASKEFREQEKYNVPFYLFLAKYHELPVHLVDKCPQFLRTDVPLPVPLRCPDVHPHLTWNTLWMSSVGRRGLVHLEPADNIDCVVSGNRRIIMVDTGKFPSFTLDRVDGLVSSIDVDSVDFISNPNVASVAEYLVADLSAGDCLYVPREFVRQIGYEAQRNIALGFFWRGPPDVETNEDFCQAAPPSSNPTLADVNWSYEKISTMKEQMQEVVKKGRSFEAFHDIYTFDDYDDDRPFLGAPRSLSRSADELIRRIFDRLDADADDFVDPSELEKVSTEGWKELEELHQEFFKLFDEAKQLGSRREEGVSTGHWGSPKRGVGEGSGRPKRGDEL